MCRRRQTRELYELIAEITIDSNGGHEALSGFEVAFENDIRFPLSGTVVGEEVEAASSTGAAN